MMERTFILCLTVSLWENMNPPFRYPDEGDEFIDVESILTRRTISLWRTLKHIQQVLLRRSIGKACFIQSLKGHLPLQLQVDKKAQLLWEILGTLTRPSLGRNILRISSQDGQDVTNEKWLGKAEKSEYGELHPNVDFPGKKVLKFR